MGPAAPSLLSPWLALCVYETLGRGPPSLLLRRGTRMLQLPRAFATSSQLLLTPWRAADSTVVCGCAALATLVEMLTLSPVLVQPSSRVSSLLVVTLVVSSIATNVLEQMF